MTASRHGRSDRLLAALSGRETVIVTHDNPDPDAIASGWAIHKLVAAHGISACLIGRGGIERAENRCLIDLLAPPLMLTDELPADDAAVILVDCVPTASNHLLGSSGLTPDAVVDHHEPNGYKFRVKFRDIRPGAAATASIAATYLKEQGLEPETNLATALLYAMHTEAIGHDIRLTRTDRAILAWLSGFADHAKLAAIRNAPLSRPYFSDLVLALECTFVYEDTAICFLPQASGTEIVGEVADMLIRCNGVRRVICAAVVDDDLALSARTMIGGGDAVKLLGAALQDLGHWGGHKHRAGGKVPRLSQRDARHDDIYAAIKDRWLRACNIDQQRGSRLVRRQAILEQL